MDLFHVWFKSYPGRVLISFWCKSDNKKAEKILFSNFRGYFSFAQFGYL